MNASQIRAVIRELEHHKYTCAACEESFYTLDQTATARCPGCAGEHPEEQGLALIPGAGKTSKPQPTTRENPYAAQHRRRSASQAPGRRHASTYYGTSDSTGGEARQSETSGRALSDRSHPQSDQVADADAPDHDETSTRRSKRMHRAAKFFGGASPEAASDLSDHPVAGGAPADEEDFGASTDRLPSAANLRGEVAAAPEALSPTTDDEPEIAADGVTSTLVIPRSPASADLDAPSTNNMKTLALDDLETTGRLTAETETMTLDSCATRTLGAESGKRRTRRTKRRSRRRGPAALSNLDKQDAGLTGQELGGCEVVKLLGRGGMGSVYLAHQIDLERDVAIKVLSPKLTDDARQVEQFFREAKALARVEHRNIVTIYQVGSDADVHFLVMQLVTGGSLGDLLKAQKRLEVEQACDCVVQVARGLGAAHKAGIIHRDVKPDNVLLAQDAHGPVMKVTDFGLARVEGDGGAFTTGKIVGTPYYMSPEQIDSSKVDLRTDIYALGATFYHLITGQPPFDGETAVDILLSHVNDPLIPPRELRRSIPEGISNVICKMLAKDPAERYADMAELLDDLDRAREGEEVEVNVAKVTEGRGSSSGGYALKDLQPMASLLEPILIERPRSLRVLAVGLAAALVVAVGVGVGPVKELLADDEPAPAIEERLPRHELEARQALGSLLSGIGGLELRERLAAFEDLVRAHPDTEAARDAAARAAAARTELENLTRGLADAALAESKELAAADHHGHAIEVLLAVPDYVNEMGLAPGIAEAERSLREQLAERGLAYVPEGSFRAGDAGRTTGANREREAWTAGFYIDVHEVSNAEYAEFVRSGGEAPATWSGDTPPDGAGDLPVTGVTLAQARAYAAYRGKRLPTALEWEKAARGLEGARFPWGDAEMPDACNWAGAGEPRPAPVGSFPLDKSPWGCRDMAGNVAELTVGPGLGDGRVPPEEAAVWVRGGSHGTGSLANCRAAFFYDGADADGHPLVGFRCAASVE
jgi:formylglycine-generating enzyme required for sulfatase activity